MCVIRYQFHAVSATGLANEAVKDEIELQRARQESQRQLQQFDRELQNKAVAGRMKNEESTLPGVRRPAGGTLAPGP